MEALYSKLYDKYTKLKTKKESESEKVNREQEEKFMTYLSAADDMIEHLKSENDRLLAQVNDLRCEVTSIRFTKDLQHAEYQKLLMEEKQRHAEEIQRLRDAEQGRGCTSGDDKIENRQDNTVGGSLVGSPVSRVMMRSKRKRYSGTQTEANDQLDRGPVSSGLLKENISHCVQPKCCRPKIGDSTGGGIGATTCVFQELVECIVGMKLSINTTTTTTEMDEICISAVHQSSGYSFSLTWKNKELSSLGETEEVVYRVVSLGTFEKVAPEWMREVLIFSSRMFPIFFQRVSHIINLH